MTEQHNGKTDERQLAMDIIRQWKTDPVTRLEFGQNFGKYIDHRCGEDNKQRMH